MGWVVTLRSLANLGLMANAAILPTSKSRPLVLHLCNPTLNELE